jgi:hypothetical protein
MERVYMKPLQIISGGQTGADKGGLLGARDCGIATGGCAPKGYRTEIGIDYTLKDFGLHENTHSNYIARTKENVEASDGTALFGDITSPGTKMTLDFCTVLGRPHIVNPSAAQLKMFIEAHHVECLNIAGNRASKSPGIESAVRQIVVETFGDSNR